MSDGSNTSAKILLEPLKTIGAQDILKIGHQFYGHIRKRRRLERFLGTRRWPRRFVVISQGCIYCYNDEYSKSPLSAFSLGIYDSAEELEVKQVLHCFQIKNEDCTKPPLVFSCETGEKRETWMVHIKEAIKQAHYYSGGSRSSSDEGVSMKIPRTYSKKNLPPIPKTPVEKEADRKAGSSLSCLPESPGAVSSKRVSEYDIESDDETDLPYDDIAEVPESTEPSLVTSPMGKIPLPGMAGAVGRPELTLKVSISQRPPQSLPRHATQPISRINRGQSYVDVKLPKATTDELPSYANDDKGDLPENYINSNLFHPGEYAFDSSDREKATGYLQVKPAGTFLIRKGRSGPGKVLSVQTDTGIREFKISEKDDGTVSLDNTEYFEDIGQMVGIYTQKELPKKELNLKLLKGYKS